MQNNQRNRRGYISRTGKVLKLVFALAAFISIQGCQTGQFDRQAFGAALNQAHQMNLQNQQQHQNYINSANQRSGQRLPANNRPQKVIIKKQCAWNDYACQAYDNPSYGY